MSSLELTDRFPELINEFPRLTRSWALSTRSWARSNQKLGSINQNLGSFNHRNDDRARRRRGAGQLRASELGLLLSDHVPKAFGTCNVSRFPFHLPVVLFRRHETGEAELSPRDLCHSDLAVDSE